MSASDDFGLYVHWPFCAAKCPYCDFNSYVAGDPIDEARFLRAYKAELAFWAERLGAEKRAVTSLFFGGGTPSLMAPSLVGGIIEHVEALFGFSDGVEITLEANPQSVEAARFKDLHMAGVNRLSIGVQSFDDEALRFLGRLHTADEAKQAIETAMARFSRVSFDLIYGRPDLSLQAWAAELQTAFSFSPTHLSLYQLTIEPNTPFKRLYDAGKLVLPPDELGADLYEQTQDLCSQAGLPAYEVSNHAVPGEEARHNLLYWRYGDFLGIGPGAHGRVVIGGDRFETVEERDPSQWLALVEAAGQGGAAPRALDFECEAVEMVLMGVRLKEGLALDALEERTGFGVASSLLSELEEAGLIGAPVVDGNRVRLVPTKRGMVLSNQLATRLVEGLRPLNEGGPLRGFF